MKRVKAVFLDRDGVINEYPGDREYVTGWDGFRFLPGAGEAVKNLSAAGYRIFIISNQAGVSKGVYSRDALDTITGNMLKELNKDGKHISGVYYCTHLPEENCSCRKPNIGLVEMAIAELEKEDLNIERVRSYFVGDTIRDIQTGKASGLKTILVFSGKEKPENKNQWISPPDFTAQDLSKAVDIIIKNP